MQKNVLREAINELNIFEGDVIKIPNDCGVDYYQYKNGKLFYLCCDGPREMDDCEMYDLLSGDTYFEIIARGEDKFLVEMRELEDMKQDVSNIDCKTDEINNRMDNMENKLEIIYTAQANQIEKLKQEKEERRKKDLYDSIGAGIFFLLVAIILLIKSFI